MARINIEDCWWSDPRRERLAELVGGLMMADAIAIRAWRVAQGFWADGRKVIPIHVFETIQANTKLIQANLAEVRDDGIYIRGSSQYLEWCNERREAARSGGKKSAQRPRNAMGQLIKTSKQTPSKHQANTKQTQASGSGSGSISGSSSENKTTITHESLLASLPVALMNSWRERYEEGWLFGEIARAHEYYSLVAPEKKPKTARGWTRAVSGWIGRSKNKVLRGASSIPISNFCGFAEMP